MHTGPIGIFDSGLGGLTIWKAIHERLPAESMIYVADQARCPYGPKAAKQIVRYSEEISQFLLTQNCKMIVVACNTATAAAVEHLRERFEVPFIGLEPALKPAVAATKTGKIGILATDGTFRGRHFLRTQEQYGKGVELLLQVGHGLVKQVEEGALSSKETEVLLRSYLEPMLDQGVDQVVLGCTHYPFLGALMQEIVGDKAVILNPAPAVARQVENVLKAQGLIRPETLPTFRFFTSGEEEKLAGSLELLLPDYLPEPFFTGKINLAH